MAKTKLQHLFMSNFLSISSKPVKTLGVFLTEFKEQSLGTLETTEPMAASESGVFLCFLHPLNYSNTPLKAISFGQTQPYSAQKPHCDVGGKA